MNDMTPYQSGGMINPRQARQARDVAHYVMSQAKNAGKIRQTNYPDVRPEGRRGIVALLLRLQRMAGQAGRDMADEGRRRVQALDEGQLRGSGERQAKENAEARRRRFPMGPPSYNEGGMTYSYGVAPEIAPWSAGLAGQAQQAGQMFPHGTPAQQAAFQGMQIYGMGRGPQATRDAYQTMIGDTKRFTDPLTDIQARGIRENAARSMQDLRSRGYLMGRGGESSSQYLAEQGIQQGAAQQTSDLYARAFSDAHDRQMRTAQTLAAQGSQEQREEMERLGLLAQGGQQQFMLPYQNLQLQAGIMGLLPYRGQTQAMPTQGQGFFGSVLPTFLGGLGAYQEYQAGERDRSIAEQYLANKQASANKQAQGSKMDIYGGVKR
jgi:hypothetical protein